MSAKSFSTEALEGSAAVRISNLVYEYAESNSNINRGKNNTTNSLTSNPGITYDYFFRYGVASNLQLY